MCFVIFFGLLFITGGANVFVQSDMLQDKAIGAITVLMGVWILSLALDWVKADGIDVSVNNRVIAHDGNGRYLVKAKTSRQILGPRPHVNGNLPAGLYKVKKGLWIVDRTGHEPDMAHIEWQSMKGNFHIEPRGNTETGGLLRDIMEGYEHNYLVEDK